MNIKETIKTEWLSWVLIVIPLAILPFVWGSIPDQIPSHWNIRGEVDGYGSKLTTLLLFPALSLFGYLIIMVAPIIDPKRRVQSKQKALRAYRIVFPLIMNGLFIAVLLQALGYTFDVGKAILLVLILLFIGIGNYLSTIEPNYFIGIRTPWTLENPEVWRQTHRIAAKIWVASGLALLVLWPFVNSGLFTYLFIVAVAFMVLTPVVISYKLFNDLPHRSPD
ncbi:MAG: DUF1648 domain-containing protein [Rhodothermales bacterium]|nr:DUF1648 domain-containing protein [Rhodothermales bacterium]